MYQDQESRSEILLPFNAAEGRIVGLRALRDARRYWQEGSYQAVLGLDESYSDRYGAAGVRLSRLLIDIGRSDELETMLNRFVDDGSRDNARDRALYLAGTQRLQTRGVTEVVEKSLMIASPALRQMLLDDSIVHTAMTEYGDMEVEALGLMLYMHLDGLKSPRWGGDEEQKRIPHYNWINGKDRPLLSPLFTNMPLTRSDLDSTHQTVVNLGKGLDRVEAMVSLSEILLDRYLVSDDEVVAQIQGELDLYMQTSDLGRDVMRLWQADSTKSSVFSWLDVMDEAHKLTRLGLVSSPGKQTGEWLVEELVEGDKIWGLVAEQRTLTDVLSPIFQYHVAGGKISKKALIQVLTAYEVGDYEKDRELISQYLLSCLPQTELRDDQWAATAGRLLSYVEAVQVFSDYDKEYLDLSDDMVSRSLLKIRYEHLNGLAQGISALDTGDKNQALLSFYRFGPEKVRLLVNHSFDWSRTDLVSILSRLETLPQEMIGEFLNHLANN